MQYWRLRVWVVLSMARPKGKSPVHMQTHPLSSADFLAFDRCPGDILCG